ncbi:MAG: D-alanyl-D-alanine carboxypeptidase, partial [Oscillospiraceae bacterium]|nr:D-alanyl-D-alanine carboxypeptidase [Oscillospiraceae bacterium]
MKRSIALGLGLAMAFLLTAPAYAAPVQVSAPSAILMEKTTGKVLYQQDAEVQYEPASVTKVMTLLLVMEAIDSGSLG